MPLTLGSHATALGAQHILCSCPQLGCSQKMIEYMGQVHQGQLFSRTSYPSHLAAINRLLEATTPLPTPSNQPSPPNQPPTFGQPYTLMASTPNHPVASTSHAPPQPTFPPIGAAMPSGPTNDLEMIKTKELFWYLGT
ncbi:uncharacterized protein MELLADRAFT_84941 [Melampsora larici-populina 98AG31]|uniref:Uncharacterized protein n=1 Tax=Melampsora larici-populina (strain 98AG31 / pathotype 3-4-7) TaxID=747676 RepID=F4RHG5_MELLP|nr:uncharacterized protein MELLADRAFT_84941 [Melampsora larici-populina 98AG31]EGG08360.1 hypothetical protein MELLADRAFT_84941 [Melampsora larici-populina 98AG31]